MRVPDIQTDFGGGEVSPQTYGRVDLPIYKRACSLLENAIPMPGGGVMRIGGTRVLQNLGEPFRDEYPAVMACASFRNGSAGEVYGLVVFGVKTGSGAAEVHFMNMTSGVWGSNDRLLLWAGGSTSISMPSDGGYDLVVGHDAGTGDKAVFVANNGSVIKVTTAGGAPVIEEATNNTKRDWVGTITPNRIGIYQGRLLLAETDSMELFGSNAGDFSDFDVSAGSVDADPYQFTVESEVSNGIRWMVDQETLLLGCNASEIQISSSVGGAVTRNSAIAREYTRIGSGNGAKGTLVDDKVIFPSAGRSGIRAYEYLNDFQAFSSPHLSEHADHIAKIGIRQMALQPLPDGQIVWCILYDGTVAGFRYNSTTRGSGWFRLSKEIGAIYCGVAFGSVPNPNWWQKEAQHRLFFAVIRDGTLFVEELLLEVEAAATWDTPARFQSTIREGHDLPFLRHCSPNLFIDPAVYIPAVFRRNIEKMEQDGSGVKITWDLPMNATAGWKWRIYGNRKYQSIHQANFIFETDASGASILSATTSHSTTLTEVSADGELGWIQHVENFGEAASSQAADILALGLLDGSDYFAVADGEIFATNCKIDANGTLVDASTSTTTGLSVYGHSLYFGKYKYKTVIQTLPLEPGVGQGGRFNRAVEAQIRFVDTMSAKVGADRYATFPVDFTDASAPSGEPPLPQDKRKTVTVKGNPSKDDDAFITITSDYEGPLKVVGLSAYIDVGGS